MLEPKIPMTAFYERSLKRSQIISAVINVNSSKYTLTHFMPLVSFGTPWKYQKTFGFLIFSGGVSKETSGMKWVNQTVAKDDFASIHVITLTLYCFINLFNTSGLFLDPLKTSENQGLSVFRGYRKRLSSQLKTSRERP